MATLHFLAMIFYAQIMHKVQLSARPEKGCGKIQN